MKECLTILSQISLIITDYQEIWWYVMEEKSYKDAVAHIDEIEARVEDVRRLIMDCLCALFRCVSLPVKFQRMFILM
jgi:hypothetical protein